ncbi:MAG: hypothetical protein EBS94_07330 [Proteobacteria bacterium]|nr:hypothetical protein [Pseudomonadota bacterium]
MIKAEVVEVTRRRDLRKPGGGSADVLPYPVPSPSLADRAWLFAANRRNRRGSITVRQGARP